MRWLSKVVELYVVARCGYLVIYHQDSFAILRYVLSAMNGMMVICVL